ncbi:MAG: hypothetical protein Q8P72_05665 [Candidatus Roizmanbacteria bacterium]|nr:hypothetical protein [Candidatus Roizmanbacteria bacterium]
MYVPHTDAQMLEIQGRFAGAVFEIAAQLEIQRDLPHDQELLNPNDTALYYYGLYGGTIIENLLHNYGLMGQLLPDGLVFRKKRALLEPVKEIYEYTLEGGEEKFDEKVRAMHRDKKTFPNIFGAAPYIFITPRMDRIPTALRACDWVRHKQLPFTHGDFRDFVDGIFGHYNRTSDPGAASLRDTQDRVRSQTKTAFGALTSGEPLTWVQQGEIQYAIENLPIEMFLN